MWESPIKTICDEMRTQFEGEVLKAVQRVGIEVDKDQLVKALNYDRKQYEKGLLEGYAKAKSEIIRCKDCKYHRYEGPIPCCTKIDYGYGWTDDDFCSYAERRTDE